jgi:hypothetical protein
MHADKPWIVTASMRREGFFAAGDAIMCICT